MTVSFFNIGHACPVQRSYELLLRVEILLSHTLFFFYLPPARLSLVCLVILVAGWYHIRILHIICFSFLLHLFLHLFIYLPLATRCVIAQGEHTAVSHLVGLNFLLAHIISSGSYHFALFSCFRTCVFIWFATPEVVTELN